MKDLKTASENLPANVADRIAALRNQSAIEVWQPDPGECLAGVLTGWQKAVGTYGENWQILIKDEHNNTTAAWVTPWLKENLRAQGADRGSIIAITFLGKKQSPNGRPYNAYSLVVDNGETL